MNFGVLDDANDADYDDGDANAPGHDPFRAEGDVAGVGDEKLATKMLLRPDLE